MVHENIPYFNRYIDLACKIRAEHKNETEIVPFAIGALGLIFKQLKIFIDVLVFQT